MRPEDLIRTADPGIAQQVRRDFLTSGQYYWGHRLVTSHNECVWRNPADGFVTGCTDWAPLSACWTDSPHGDLLFQLLDETPSGDGGDGCIAVPALDPPGVLLLVLALGAGSACVLARRRRV